MRKKKNKNVRGAEEEGGRGDKEIFTVSSKSCRCLVLRYLCLNYLRIIMSREILLAGLGRAQLLEH